MISLEIAQVANIHKTTRNIQQKERKEEEGKKGEGIFNKLWHLWIQLKTDLIVFFCNFQN